VILTNVNMDKNEKRGRMAVEGSEQHVHDMEAAWREMAGSVSPPLPDIPVVSCMCVRDATEEIARVRETLNPGVAMQVFVLGSTYVVGGMIDTFQLW
jgi:hypothetical protein